MQPKIEVSERILADPASKRAGFIGGGRGVGNAQTFVRLAAQRAQGIGAGSGQPHPRRAGLAGARMFLNPVRHPLRRRGGGSAALHALADGNALLGSGVRRSVGAGRTAS